jgi:hypothetical protein
MINNGPGASASTPQTTYWEALTTELSEIDADLNRKLGELGAAWEGAAGESAQAGLTPLQAWATDAQSGSSLMGSSTEYQADMISRARAEMPEPVEVTTPAPSGWEKVAAGAALLTGNAGPAAAVVGQAQDHEAQESKQDAASQKAVDTMDSYQSSSEFNRNTLGTFVPPPDVVVATPEPATTPGGAIGGFSTNFSGTGHGTTSTNPAGYTPPPTTGHGSFVPAPGSVGTPTYTPPTHTTPVPSSYLPPSSTTAQSFALPTATTGSPSHINPISTGAPTSNPTNFSGNLPVGPGSTSTVGGGGGSKSGSPLGSGSGGKGGASGLGQGGTGQAGESARQGNQLGKGGGAGAGGMGSSGPGATGGRGGAGGAGGRGGMGAGGAGGGAQDEEDTEYQLADYLVETEDVFGDDRVVAPGVIGGTPEQ